MTPRHAPKDAAHHFARDANLSTNSLLGHSLPAQGENPKRGLLGKLRHMVLFTSLARTDCGPKMRITTCWIVVAAIFIARRIIILERPPTLSRSVQEVIGPAASKQMCRVHAAWVVATMAGVMIAIQRRTGRQPKRKARCRIQAAQEVELPITTAIGGSDPHPALIQPAFGNLGPEPVESPLAQLRRTQGKRRNGISHGAHSRCSHG